jgi:hypothetical protein
MPAILAEAGDPMLTLLALASVRLGDVTGDPKQPDKPPMSWEPVDSRPRCGRSLAQKPTSRCACR